MFTHVWIALDVRILAPTTDLKNPRCLGRDRGLRLPWEICACRVSAALAAHALLAGSFYAIQVKAIAYQVRAMLLYA